MSELSSLPKRFAAGTTVSYRRVYSNYPASEGWVLKLLMRGPSSWEKQADTVEDAFLFTIAPANTTSQLPGTYTAVEQVSRAGEVYNLWTETITLDPDFATASGNSLLSWAEQCLPIVQAAIKGQLTDGIRRYEIAGRAVERYDIWELMKLRAYFLDVIRQHRTRKPMRTIGIRFQRP